MKLFFKKSWHWLSGICLLLFVTLTLVLVKVEYEVTTVGALTLVDEFIEIDVENKPSVNINTVAVYSYPKVNLLNYIIAKMNPYASITKINTSVNVSNDYVVAQGTLHKRLSIYNAIIAGYEAAGYSINKRFSGYTVTTIYNYCQSDLEIGDVFKTVGEYEINEETSVTDAIKNYTPDGSNDLKISATVLRNGKTIEIQLIFLKDKEYKAGFGVESYYIPSNSDEEIPDYDYNMGDTIGPSGGLMQSLYIYEVLTGGLLTKNLKIAGTGTVDIYGNAGLIGGIEQKVFAAELAGMDYFFVPVDMRYADKENQCSNWNDALRAYQTLKNPHVKLVPVKSLTEVINFLEGLNETN